MRSPRLLTASVRRLRLERDDGDPAGYAPRSARDVRRVSYGSGRRGRSLRSTGGPLSEFEGQEVLRNVPTSCRAVSRVYRHRAGRRRAVTGAEDVGHPGREVQSAEAAEVAG